jgi:hypothetical protein
MSLTAVYFKNINYFKDTLSKENMVILSQEVTKVKNNFNTLKADNNKLAGNIAREYNFDQSATDTIKKILSPYAKTYFETNRDLFQTSGEIKLDSAWVNFQSKYEFNPMHSHGGDISFVIWVNIPYSYSDEMKNKSVIYSNNPLAGCFQFLYTDILGILRDETINCDKSLEGTMLMFPSRLHHTVYPFYTSDDYRISISGNFSIQ